MEKPTMTAQEMGRKGGQKTAATHGHEFYVEIGRQGAKKRRLKKQKEA